MEKFSYFQSIYYICHRNLVYIMTEEDRKLLNTFEGKFRHLLFLYDELKKKNASLKAELSEKESEIQTLKNSLKESEERYTNLKMARMISVNDNEIRDTKQRLARLVREVDKCIALLNE